MNISDAIYKTVRDAAGGPEVLAVRMGLRTQILRNKANPNSDTNYFSPLELDTLMALTADTGILQAYAINHGYTLIRTEQEVDSSDMAVLEMLAKVMSSTGDVGAELYATLADGKVEQHEVEKVEAVAVRAKMSLDALVSRLKGMVQK
ncbi:hypothetical protein FHW58_003420 [Duganella sp. 1224]|uniref:phage regulatory CII family protein n=1 Tax=Duganella sp. 1224 TaxID=2587052 RepID=UPI0015C6FDCF|nr:phage regulatory CII family protein [Duganella sp. 1224]NYE62205.1 hypothetical protein [Duganella sp. 1224]